MVTAVENDGVIVVLDLIHCFGFQGIPRILRGERIATFEELDSFFSRFGTGYGKHLLADTGIFIQIFLTDTPVL